MSWSRPGLWVANFCLQEKVSFAKTRAGLLPSECVVEVRVAASNRDEGRVVPMDFNKSVSSWVAERERSGFLKVREPSGRLRRYGELAAEQTDEFVALPEPKDEKEQSARDARLEEIGWFFRYDIQAKEHPQLFRCTSVAEFGTKDSFLFVPGHADKPFWGDPAADHPALAAVPVPTEPTIYTSLNEATLPILIRMLWNQPDDLSKDVAIRLLSEREAGVIAARVALMGVADTTLGWPSLRGSLKQVLWAIDIRRATADLLWSRTGMGKPKSAKLMREEFAQAKAAQGSSMADAFDNFVTAEKRYSEPKLVQAPQLATELLMEFETADDAKKWIDSRRQVFKWLGERRRTRQSIDAAIVKG